MSQENARTVEIGNHLPFLRRYSRALTGSQASGDAYAAATLEAILQDANIFGDMPIRTGLFRVFHSIWISSGAPIDKQDAGLEGSAQRHLSKLTKNTREALLLNTIEGFNPSEVGQIIDVPVSEAEDLIALAHEEMHASIKGRVMIIEDEPIIAADLEAIVEQLDHEVVGIARTRSQAVRLGLDTKPDLILADIQLADNSSGIDAVNDLLAELSDTPVIFITAFPERLLTGNKPEPAFLISKPYSSEQVNSAVSQAMFFASTESLKA